MGGKVSKYLSPSNGYGNPQVSGEDFLRDSLEDGYQNKYLERSDPGVNYTPEQDDSSKYLSSNYDPNGAYQVSELSEEQRSRGYPPMGSGMPPSVDDDDDDLSFDDNTEELPLDVAPSTPKVAPGGWSRGEGGKWSQTGGSTGSGPVATHKLNLDHYGDEEYDASGVRGAASSWSPLLDNANVKHTSVRYLRGEEGEKQNVSMQDGKLVGSDGNPIDTSSASGTGTWGGSGKGRFLYAKNKDGQLRAIDPWAERQELGMDTVRKAPARPSAPVEDDDDDDWGLDDEDVVAAPGETYLTQEGGQSSGKKYLNTGGGYDPEQVGGVQYTTEGGGLTGGGYTGKNYGQTEGLTYGPETGGGYTEKNYGQTEGLTYGPETGGGYTEKNYGQTEGLTYGPETEGYGPGGGYTEKNYGQTEGLTYGPTSTDGGYSSEGYGSDTGSANKYLSKGYEGETYTSPVVYSGSEESTLGETCTTPVTPSGGQAKAPTGPQKRDVHLRFINHSSLFGGDEVAGAGDMVVDKGDVKLVSDASGHYKPSNQMLHQTVNGLVEQGAKPEGMTVELGHKRNVRSGLKRGDLQASALEFLSYGGSGDAEKHMRQARQDRKSTMSDITSFDKSSLRKVAPEKMKHRDTGDAVGREVELSGAQRRIKQFEAMGRKSGGTDDAPTRGKGGRTGKLISEWEKFGRRD